MGTRGWFVDLPDDFEESVRIDRDDDGYTHRENAIFSYHLTADSHRFVHDFIDRLCGQSDDMRSGSNYWLYGYYGSGKSHLLTVLDGLLDTSWIANSTVPVWESLVDNSETDSLAQLESEWKALHDEYYVIPISINLLKYQGQKQRSFSEIVLRHAHQDPNLTGVDDEISTGLSSQLDVAYFEKWLQTTAVWDDRQVRAATVIESLNRHTSVYDWDEGALWKDIQQYGALADVILPQLFAEINGTPDGYEDLQPSDIDPEVVVNRLAELRSRRENELDRPVKLVLLLDEVSLFIGTEFERLTELQTLAEHIDEIGEGHIQLVATAQAKIEDVQPQFAAHGADFSIVKDRFPHRYQLPSKHVGEIAKQRLFTKSSQGSNRIGSLLETATVQPSESLVYNEIKQNTNPPLDQLDEEDLVAFYPFLPYHAPLFLEILFNLRQEANDPAKSIFSGTARAILALMHNLLQEWVENGEKDHVVTLVDLYDQIEPELRDILKQDMRVIEGVTNPPLQIDQTEEEEDDDDDPAGRGIIDDVQSGELEPFDLDVAKAVLLLQHVHDIIPLSESNIAVAVMDDLNGRSWVNTQNRVRDSLDRLQKYIRPNEDPSGPQYRFATQEERQIYDTAEANEASPKWTDVIETVDEHLWDDVIQELSLPDSIPYGESGDAYPVEYTFAIDGTPFSTSVDREGGVAVSMEIHGIRPDMQASQTEEKTLYWSIDTDGIGDLRDQLLKWWALSDAVETHTVPKAVERDLNQRASTVQRKLVSALQRGTYTIKDRSEIRGIETAVQTAVDVAYPDDFHPMMLQVTDDRLRELASLSGDEPLPAWAQTIQVPSTDQSGSGSKRTIQRNVLSLTGRQIKDRDDGLNVTTILDGIVNQKPIYDETREALCAILWGYCRVGRLVLIDESGSAVENSVLLDRNRRATVRLKLLPRLPLPKLLVDGGFKTTTQTVDEGLIALRKANTDVRSSLQDLKENVKLVAETDIHSSAVSGLLTTFVDELDRKIDATTDRLELIKDQDERIERAIEDTNAATAWLTDVQDVWERRQGTLYQFDAQFVCGADRFVWVDDSVRDEVTAQHKVIDTYDAEWWTTDGWTLLIEQTDPSVSKMLTRAWKTYTDETGITAFVEEITDSPWVVPPTQLPRGVHPAFERTHLSPLRAIQRWYTTIDEAMSAIEHGQSDALLTATDALSDTQSFGNTVDLELNTIQSRFETLKTVVGDHSPDQIDHIGMIPDDRQILNRQISAIIEDREVDVTVSDSGVIIE